MAGDWIKIEHTTPDKPEVHAVAEMLGIDPDAVLGKLVRIWVWADQHTTDGNAVSVTGALPSRHPGVTRSLLDRISGVDGFADALERSGWLTRSDDGLVFPNFAYHNGQTAKQRALTAKRVAKHKSAGNAKGNAASVTSALPREEKRREEEIRPPIPPADAGSGVGSKPVKAKKTPGADPLFDRFWAAYPRRVAKQDAVKAWAKVGADEDVLSRILAAVARESRSREWAKEGGRFIPHPATWLNGRRWEDEPLRLVGGPEPAPLPDPREQQRAHYQKLVKLDAMPREEAEELFGGPLDGNDERDAA